MAEEKKRNIIGRSKKFQTVGKNKNGFSERKYNVALVARNIYYMVGFPTLQKLKMMIRQNIIQNFPVTVEDIKIADKIFGSDVSSLKGITTIQRPKVVVDDFI